VVIFRADRQLLNEPPYRDFNRLPLCTLYGDGRVVWTNYLQPQGEEVLEALIDDVQFRSFLEFLIRDMKFYEIPDYAGRELPPADNTGIDSLTIYLAGQVHTARNYKLWPNDVYNIILEKCRTLSDAPVRVEPEAGWVTAYEVPEPSNAPFIDWPATAPFTLADVAAQKQAGWVSGPAFKQLWIAIRDTLGNIMWRENGKMYLVALQVPTVSRDAPPAPPPSATLEPTVDPASVSTQPRQ
jgi:hypothetical protein